jgi:hypothetical protein
MELAKCTQEEKFSSRLRKELSLTVTEYVQKNLMYQLTERVKMKGTNNKRERKGIENVCFSATTYITLERIYIRHTFCIISIYNTESEKFFIIQLLKPMT